MIFHLPAIGQIEVVEVDSTYTKTLGGKGLFFTNRPLASEKSDKIRFKNKGAKQTDELYFGWYNYESDKINLNYQASNTGDKSKYPTGKVINNKFYDFYHRLRIEKGIKHMVILIPGYGKSFKDQTDKFMERVRKRYTDTLSQDAAFATFAWATKSSFVSYHSGKITSKRSAHDFAIFQHMLEGFLSDSTFFANNPNDVSFYLVCLSMGNVLLQKYLKERKKQGIPIVKTYENVILLGSDVHWNSFNEGKGFHELHKLTDNITLVVNKKDALLRVASYMNMSKRLGAKGLKYEKDAPENLAIIHIEDDLVKEDMAKLGHDYFLTNPYIREEFIEYLQVEEVAENYD